MSDQRLLLGNESGTAGDWSGPVAEMLQLPLTTPNGRTPESAMEPPVFRAAREAAGLGRLLLCLFNHVGLAHEHETGDGSQRSE